MPILPALPALLLALSAPGTAPAASYDAFLAETKLRNYQWAFGKIIREAEGWSKLAPGYAARLRALAAAEADPARRATLEALAGRYEAGHARLEPARVAERQAHEARCASAYPALQRAYAREGAGDLPGADRTARACAAEFKALVDRIEAANGALREVHASLPPEVRPALLAPPAPAAGGAPDRPRR